MLKALELTIKKYFKNGETLSRSQFIEHLKDDYPTWSLNTINAYLYRLKKNKIIKSPTRGVYTLDSIQTFSPTINKKLKEIACLISNKLPYIDYCVSDTSWLNDFMTHQPFKKYIVIEIEKTAIEQVFSLLFHQFKNVYLNPDRLLFTRYIDNVADEEVIIIKNLNTESPTLYIDNIKISSLEKTLVDILIDEDLYSAQQSELDNIFQNVFKKLTINESKMKRYASRRNREIELEKRININLAK